MPSKYDENTKARAVRLVTEIERIKYGYAQRVRELIMPTLET